MNTAVQAVVTTLVAAAILPAVMFGQPGPSSAAFPTDAMVVESRSLPESAHPNRALVLWMLHPEKHPRFEEGFRPTPDMSTYSCPEETLGSYYSGPTRVSLLDSVTNRIINTITVRTPFGDKDDFEVPYLIHPYFYRVEPPLKDGEGKPVIMDLKDYTGDGKALEFGFFAAGDCNLLLIQLVGYSQKQDRVIQYPVSLKNWDVDDRGKITTGFWLDRVFLQNPIRPGVWNYTVPERFCYIPTYQVHYDAAQERFLGTVSWLRCDR